MKLSLIPKSRAVKKDILIGAGITVVLLVAALLWGQPLMDALGNREQAKQLIESAGIFGPLVFILIQIAQVVVAPLPGQVSGLVGGYLFGVIPGTIYSLIGATVGFLIIFAMARKLGRPFVERYFSKELIGKFDYITKSKGTLALFIIFLLPAFPDDLICYLAGLSKIPIRKLLLVSIAGRLPGYLILSMTGSGLSYENMNPIIITLAAALILFGLAFWQRAWLQGLTKSSDYILYIKNNWRLSKSATTIWIVAFTSLSVFMYWAATVTPVQQ
jgi:uncharacterized membrane protein YdjX (TVP38/TMEM64 family)